MKSWDGIISYVVKLLKKEGFNHNSRTIIQKVVYFALSQKEREKVYMPYLYGPFSEEIQISIVNFENNVYHEKSGLPKLSEKDFAKKLEKVITFLKKHNLKLAKEISSLSKVHFLISLGIKCYLKDAAQLLGWSELASSSHEALERLTNMSLELEKYVHGKSIYK